MHDANLLQALFPEWNQIVCLVVPDFYHRYTVDEHTLVTIEKLAELAGVKEGPSQRFAEILSEIENLALLRFALLFHDSGKGSNTGDHSTRSVELAREVMHRIKMPAEDQAAVEFLIEHHLDLSAVMNSVTCTIRSRLHAGGAHWHHRTTQASDGSHLRRYLSRASRSHDPVATGKDSDRLIASLHQELLRELETDRIKEAAGGSGRTGNVHQRISSALSGGPIQWRRFERIAN